MFIHLSLHESKAKVLGMPSPEMKNQNIIMKQNSPGTIVSWRHSLFRASHGLMLVGGGGV